MELEGKIQIICILYPYLIIFYKDSKMQILHPKKIESAFCGNTSIG